MRQSHLRSRPSPRSGLQVGPISKKMLRNTNSDYGRFTIYTVVLLSFLAAVLYQGLGLPYEVVSAILVVLLLASLLSMNRLIGWLNARRRQRFESQLEARRAKRREERESA